MSIIDPDGANENTECEADLLPPLPHRPENGLLPPASKKALRRDWTLYRLGETDRGVALPPGGCCRSVIEAAPILPAPRAAGLAPPPVEALSGEPVRVVSANQGWSPYEYDLNEAAGEADLPDAGDGTDTRDCRFLDFARLVPLPSRSSGPAADVSTSMPFDRTLVECLEPLALAKFIAVGEDVGGAELRKLRSLPDAMAGEGDGPVPVAAAEATLLASLWLVRSESWDLASTEPLLKSDRSSAETAAAAARARCSSSSRWACSWR